MLDSVAEGVFVHRSRFCASNSVVVLGNSGVLVIDAGVHEHEIVCLARDLKDAGHVVLAGFSTHPHWDHLLWHRELGESPRYGTEACAATVRERLADGIDARRFGIPDDVALELLGVIVGLPAAQELVPWDGPAVRLIEHRAHAPGHAALLIGDRSVLVAGDMLSDVLVPMLDLNGTAEPVQDYLDALSLLEAALESVDVVVPGHGSSCGTDQALERLERDRAYVIALGNDEVVDDPRISDPATGWEWVRDVHLGQRARLAAQG